MSLYKLNWDIIMEIDAYIISPKKRKEKIDRALTEVGLFFKKNILLDKKLDNNVDVLFVKTMYRDDYNQIFNLIVDASDVKRKSIFDLQYIDKFSFFKKIYIIIKYFPICFKFKRRNIYDWFFLIARSWFYLEVYESIKNIKYNKLVVFSDMQPIDNLIVQLANLNNKLTVSLQHGLYVDYERHDNVNVVNYKNVVSKYFLAWGDDTKKLLQKYHNNLKIVLCGRPIDTFIKESGSQYFTVVFDQNVFFNQNRELLEIAYKVCKEMKCNVNLKLHPNNRIEWFKIEEEYTLVDQEISKSIFVIGHTTTLIYECMAANIPSFRYKTHIPSNKLLNKLEFKTCDELINIVKNNEVMILDYKDVSKEYFSFTGKDSISEYKKFFSVVLNRN